MKQHIALVSLIGIASLAVSASAATISITDSSIAGPTGVAGTDYYKYKVVGSNLTRDDAASMNLILQGSAPVAGNTNPQGNVELFASSETATYNGVTPGGAFNTVARTSFSGTLQTIPITVSSLNGADWFTTTSSTYDPTYAGSGTSNTLARKWFNDFFSTYNFDTVLSSAGVTAGTIATERTNLYSAFLTQNGFQRISDPNVSYVNQDTVSNQIDIGLAGNQDYVKTFILAYINSSPNLTTPQRVSVLTQVNAMTIDASEAMLVNYNSSPQYLYSFSSAAVGLTTDDTTESYNRNFNISIAGIVPEPTSMGLIALAFTPLIKRRRR